MPAAIPASEAVSPPAGPVHLAVGMFDGVHLGHREVLAPAVRNARVFGGSAGVLTFSPHPSRLFRPESPTPLLLDAATKRSMLKSCGVDFVINQPFDAAFAAMPASDFLPWIRSRLPGLASLCVGENFRFGQGRRGDVALLVAQGREAGVRIFVADRVDVDGERVSSTRIRSLIMAGRVAEAAALLGYEYFGEGAAVPGRRLGRTLGFPTLNFAWTPEVRPAFGVYAAHITGADGVRRAAVANYGIRPTVENAPIDPLLEVHVLADSTEVAAAGLKEGAAAVFSLRRLLRPEMKFDSLESLRAQIARDLLAVGE